MEILNTMQEKIGHFFFGEKYDTEREACHQSIKDRVYQAALVVFWACTIPCMIYYNSMTFLVGLVIGMARIPKIDETVDRIIKIWTDHFLVMGAGTGLFYYLGSEAVVIGAGTLVLSARLGRYLADTFDPKVVTETAIV